MSLEIKKGINAKNEEQNNNKLEPENDDPSKSHLNIKNIIDYKEEGKDNIQITQEDKNKSHYIETSVIALNNNYDKKNYDNLIQINNEDIQSKNKIDTNNNNTNVNSTKKSFIQRTKSWMSNMWTNVKNYDYGKFNIFRGPEMEDILDAHGLPMRIPKKKHKKILVKKDKNEDFIKDDMKYFESINKNVFNAYPF